LQDHGELLDLAPVSHVALYAAPEQRRPPAGVSRTWTRRATWDVPAPALFAALCAGLPACVLAACLLFVTRRRRLPRDFAHALGGALVLAGGLVLLVLQRQGNPA